MQGDILLTLFFGNFLKLFVRGFHSKQAYKVKNEADFEWSASTFTDL